MLLRPRKFNYKNAFKRRRLINAKIKSNLFRFGTQSLVITENVVLTSQKMFRLKLLLKKSSRRSDKTSRKLWFNAFPHLPLTKKVIGSRMGKGKGKLNSWFTTLPAGSTLFEVKNLRRGRLIYFSRQIRYRLGCECLCFTKGSNLKRTSYYYSKARSSTSYSMFF